MHLADSTSKRRKKKQTDDMFFDNYQQLNVTFVKFIVPLEIGENETRRVVAITGGA